MAVDTPISLRQSVIYSVFVRNYSEEGTFQAVERDLNRIKSLGTDIIWFLPFYPLGEENRKGSLGSPYAIKDYRNVDSSHGTIEDFKRLVHAIHERGMKAMIDIVFNHTSHDSILLAEHPEWFYRKEDGSLGNQVGEWTDIIDLDYRNLDLWDYQIETLKQWAAIVDGFRCDVAPLIPLKFWQRARKEVTLVKPDFIWLSETIHLSFVREMRKHGVLAHSDGEIYQAFDITYEYDTHDAFDAYIKGEIPLSRYTERLNNQDVSLPANYVKLRFLENHDQPRVHSLVPQKTTLVNWTAFLFLQKGTTLLYNGQEVMGNKLPSLFDLDKINWKTGEDISPLISRLAKLKKDPMLLDANYYLYADDDLDTVVFEYNSKGEVLVGICCLGSKSVAGSKIKVPVIDGDYSDLLNNQIVEVSEGEITLNGSPIIFKARFNA